jgi:hypothetical protein
MSKHTPGPWKLNRINGKLVIGGNACGAVNVIQIAVVTQFRQSSISEANARLIESAPALLNMLERMVAETNDRESKPCLLTLEQANEAIKSARATEDRASDDSVGLAKNYARCADLLDRARLFVEEASNNGNMVAMKLLREIRKALP